MKKQIISLLLIATVSMSLIVGCGNKEVGENTEKQSEIETESESVTELEAETSTEIETTVETTEQEETQENVETETSTNNDGGSTNGGTIPSGGRYGGCWDVEGSGTYTGATVYTNSTYGTSFTIPTGTTVWGNDRPEIYNSTYPILLAKANNFSDFGITLCFGRGSTLTESIDIEKKSNTSPAWTCGETYTTTIGGNTYHCFNVVHSDGSQDTIYLFRESGGKILMYETTASAVQYISY